MSSEVETSRDQTGQYLDGILRLRYASLRMTSRVHVGILCSLTCAFTALAQESPTPTSSAITEESPALSISPTDSIAPSPEQTPSPSPARNVRISFVPPPLEGRISLGIYDAQGKLARVLHHEADLREFTIGADALVTQWDGKNDIGEDLPAGRYHARGYLVGPLKVEDVGQAAAPPEENSNAGVKVKLMPNPLANDTRALVALSVGFDNNGSYLKTNDGLPLFTITKSPNLSRVSIAKKGDKSVDIWQTDGAGFHQSRISNVDQIMAFDCGEFELK
jgi:hypothetical protein